MAIIYQIINKKNSKKYIGKTILSMKQRFQTHQTNAFGIKQLNYTLYKAMRKYGCDNFKIELIEDCGDCSNQFLDERERYWIRKIDSFGLQGYNMNEGGTGGSNGPHSLETRKKMSLNGKGKNLGKKRPLEICKKISKTLTGRRLSLEHIKNHANAIRGRKQTPEHIEKVRQTKIGKKRSLETREKMRQSALRYWREKKNLYYERTIPLYRKIQT